MFRVSVSGNQGSVFLKAVDFESHQLVEERQKPFVYCLMELPLEKSFRSVGDAPVRSLKAGDDASVPPLLRPAKCWKSWKAPGRTSRSVAVEFCGQDCREVVQRVRCRTFKARRTSSFL